MGIDAESGQIIRGVRESWGKSDEIVTTYQCSTSSEQQWKTHPDYTNKCRFWLDLRWRD